MRVRFVVPGRTVGVNRTYEPAIRDSHARIHKSAAAKHFREIVAYYASAARRAAGIRSPWRSPCGVLLRFYFATWGSDIDGPEKSILDALEDAGIYVNDNRVTEKHTYKTRDAENPRTEIEVWSNNDPGTPWTD